MITPSHAAMLHTIPLLLTPKNGSFAFKCDMPGVQVSDVVGKDLKIKLPKPDKDQTNHQFCFVVTTPAPTATSLYYVTLYFGPSLEKLIPWTPEPGGWRSPSVDMVSASKGLEFVACVMAVQRSSTAPGINGGPVDIGVAPLPPGRRRIRTDFQHGGEIE